MDSNINKTTIEALFETDSQLEFWVLRLRAFNAGMTETELFTLLRDARQQGIVEMMPNNLIQLI
jgi:hypothetical protein